MLLTLMTEEDKISLVSKVLAWVKKSKWTQNDVLFQKSITCQWTNAYFRNGQLDFFYNWIFEQLSNQGTSKSVKNAENELEADEYFFI